MNGAIGSILFYLSSYSTMQQKLIVLINLYLFSYPCHEPLCPQMSAAGRPRDLPLSPPSPPLYVAQYTTRQQKKQSIDFELSKSAFEASKIDSTHWIVSWGGSGKFNGQLGCSNGYVQCCMSHLKGPLFCTTKY